MSGFFSRKSKSQGALATAVSPSTATALNEQSRAKSEKHQLKSQLN